jgi:hypothetical protein|tara:strand:- start:2270 stop:2464 length:195 start_codon:yes stop_codon:yes gene_type:complete
MKTEIENLRTKIVELEIKLIKSEASLEGYKDGERDKRQGADYTKYILIAIACIEGLVLALERIT